MNCATCGSEFIAEKRTDRPPSKRRFCSTECRINRGQNLPTCEQCGVKPARQGRKYCSLACSGLARSGDIVEAFWAQVTKSSGDGCWLWTGATANGYGVIQHRNKSNMATHISWQLAGNGSVPKGLVICHRCDNPPCVRPDHLFAGTKGQNNSDAYQKGRHTSQNTTAGRFEKGLKPWNAGHRRTGTTTRPLSK